MLFRKCLKVTERNIAVQFELQSHVLLYDLSAKLVFKFEGNPQNFVVVERV